MTKPNTSEPASILGSEHAGFRLAAEIVQRFELVDLVPLVRAVRTQSEKRELSLAVFGRFNTGKSSFLNQLIGRPLLPVGVVPVTSVVTELSYGGEERAEVVMLDGTMQPIAHGGIGSYISEAANPRNVKGVDVVRVFLPSLERLRGLRLVDTPGLESLFRHNTEASLAWSPNVDLALVAVGADSPLTEQDRELITRLARFTPNIAVLLTKVDVLKEDERREVLEYVQRRLRAEFAMQVPVFCFSVRRGFEELLARFEREHVQAALGEFQSRRAGALERKIEALLHEACDYLRLALKSAETADAERAELGERVLGSAQALADRKLQLRLIARHCAGGTRTWIERQLEGGTRKALEKKLEAALEVDLPRWRGSLAKELEAFERWLRATLAGELAMLSAGGQSHFCQPLRDAERQCRANLQSFRDERSEKVQRLFGVPLRTTESEIEVAAPESPDVSVGKIFDRNWELISWLIPMAVFRGAVHTRFREKTATEIKKNLSRLTTQWEERVTAAIVSTANLASQRLDDLMLTVQRLLSGEDRERAGSIRPILEQMEAVIAAREKGP
jgi:GTP-binding protein EngB required for normal cell division